MSSVGKLQAETIGRPGLLGLWILGNVTTKSVAPPPLYKVHTTHNSPIRSDEGLTLETSAFRIPVRWSIYIINSVDKTKFMFDRCVIAGCLDAE